MPLLSPVEVAHGAASDSAKRKRTRPLVPVPVSPRTFAMVVQGDSMTASRSDSFPVGSLLLVQPDLQPAAADYVVVGSAGAADVAFRQLVHDGGESHLKPLHPDYPTRPLAGATIFGVVRACFKRFR